VASDIHLRPPAAFGDIYRAAKAGVRRIGLIDAVFEDRLTVWHKEILWALSRGVEVYGAASMGAIRAVECAPFGMVGVGEIFEMYRDGTLEGDDEIAVLHGPAALNYIPITEPLVNIRATLSAAENAGIVTSSLCGRLLDLACSCYYKTLTWPSLLEAAARAGFDKDVRPLGPWLASGRVDLKRLDAERLLQCLSQTEPDRHKIPEFQFHATTFWSKAISVLDADGDGILGDETPV
jgi:hypothetical protein